MMSDRSFSKMINHSFKVIFEKIFKEYFRKPLRFSFNEILIQEKFGRFRTKFSFARDE